jgi:6-phosphogluconolactonase
MVQQQRLNLLQEMVEAGMNNIHLHQFDSDEILATNLANRIAVDLQDAIAQKNKATLILSGGNTPKKLFAALSQIDMAWEKVIIGLCDERWVPNDHLDSNEKMIKENLMQNFASKAEFIGMFLEAKSAQNSELECSKALRVGLYPFDVLVLGMGDDAHTASLFPNNEKLEEAYAREELCISIVPTTAPHTRMSLTLKAILSANKIYLHLQGASKLKVYNEALSGEDRFAMPIRSVLKQNQKEIEVYYA